MLIILFLLAVTAALFTRSVLRVFLLLMLCMAGMVWCFRAGVDRGRNNSIAENRMPGTGDEADSRSRSRRVNHNSSRGSGLRDGSKWELLRIGSGSAGSRSDEEQAAESESPVTADLSNTESFFDTNNTARAEVGKGDESSSASDNDAKDVSVSDPDDLTGSRIIASRWGLPDEWKLYYSENLLKNGGFEANTPLDGWRNAHLTTGSPENSKYIAITRDAHADSNYVMFKWHTGMDLSDVTLESDPVPCTQSGRFRLALRARSDGPGCYAYIKGYTWVKGVQPYPDPSMKDLSDVYQSSAVRFSQDSREDVASKLSSMPGSDWTWGYVFCSSGAEGDSLIGNGVPSLQFLTVYIVARGERDGCMYIDDVELRMRLSDKDKKR